MPSTEYSHKIKVLLAFGAIYFIWGSTFYAVSIALKEFPAFFLSTMRLLIAGTALLVVCVFRREKIPPIADILKNALCGVIIFVGGILSVVWSQQYISSSLASTIITTPFWFILLDKRERKFYFSSKWIIGGLLTGLAGVVLLLGFKQTPGHEGNHEMQAIAMMVMITGSAMWAGGSLYIKYNPGTTSVYVRTCMQLLAAGFFCLVISLIKNEPQHIVFIDIATRSWVALLYLSIASSLITFMAFIWLIKIKPPAVVSTYAYVNPVVAVLLGWGFGNEYISGIQLMALATILCGLFFVNIPKYSDRK